LCGDVDDRDHALVGHARRADDAHRADDAAVDFVGRGHDRAFVEGDELRLPADEDLHAVGMLAALEELEELGLLLEEVEETAQARHVGGELVDFEEVASTRDDHAVGGAQRRGATTTPAKCVRSERICEAAATTRCGSSGRSWPSICWRSTTSIGRTVRSESTNRRYPFGVGTRPAEVCGLVTKPISSRSAMT